MATPNPDNIVWDDDMSAYLDTETNEYYRDEDGKEPLYGD